MYKMFSCAAPGTEGKGQDSAYCLAADGVYAMAVADGITSAGPTAKYGAEIATRSIVRYLIEQFDKIIAEDSEKLRNIFFDYFRWHFCEKLDTFAKIKGFQRVFDDETKGFNKNFVRNCPYSATLIACAVKNDLVITMKIGNGVMGADVGNGFGIVSPSTLIDGYTSGLEMILNVGFRNFEFKRYRLDYLEGIILMSDGFEVSTPSFFEKDGTCFNETLPIWLNSALSSQEEFENQVNQIGKTGPDDVSMAILFRVRDNEDICSTKVCSDNPFDNQDLYVIRQKDIKTACAMSEGERIAAPVDGEVVVDEDSKNTINDDDTKADEELKDTTDDGVTKADEELKDTTDDGATKADEELKDTADDGVTKAAAESTSTTDDNDVTVAVALKDTLDGNSADANAASKDIPDDSDMDSDIAPKSASDDSTVGKNIPKKMKIKGEKAKGVKNKKLKHKNPECKCPDEDKRPAPSEGNEGPQLNKKQDAATNIVEKCFSILENRKEDILCEISLFENDKLRNMSAVRNKRGFFSGMIKACLLLAIHLYFLILVNHSDDRDEKLKSVYACFEPYQKDPTPKNLRQIRRTLKKMVKKETEALNPKKTFSKLFLKKLKDVLKKTGLFFSKIFLFINHKLKGMKKRD